METTLGTHPAGSVSAREPVSAPRLVFLVGFMGAGKSSVGKALAAHLGWQFEDLDDHIVARVGRPIEQIFRESGEPEFRRAEHGALRSLLSEPVSAARVVALGGGAFVQPENAELLAQAGALTVFLDAPVEVLFRRCQQEQQVGRPLRRSQEEFGKLYEARRPHYLKAALRVDTHHHEVEAVAHAVARGLGLQPANSSREDMP
jgi:shikimate kinase